MLALVLGAVGLFSAVSYSVTQRTNEFGIRMALGAQPMHVLRIVFSSMLIDVGAGIAAGLVLILLLSRASPIGRRAMPTSPLSCSSVLIVVAALACTARARRAAKVEPMTALRYE